MPELMAQPATRRLSLWVALSSAGAVLIQLVTAVWIVAGYHYQVQDQSKRIVELEVSDKKHTDTVGEINLRLARMEGRLLAALDHPPLRKQTP